MPMNLIQTAELTSHWSQWFFTGEMGTGKTLIASTFPRPIFFEPRNENSSTTLTERSINVPLNKIYSKVQMEEDITELVDMYKRDPEGFPYDTIVIESLSHYAELLIDSLTNGNQVTMDLRRWGQFSSHLSWIHSRLSEIEAHIVFTAQAAPDEKTGDMVVLLPGKSKRLLPSVCGAVGFCDAVWKSNKMTYTTYFRPYRGFPARSRYNTPLAVKDFTFKEVYLDRSTTEQKKKEQ